MDAPLSSDTLTTVRDLPSVDEILRCASLRPWLERLDREYVVSAVRKAIDEARASLLQGTALPAGIESLATDAILRLTQLTSSHLKPVVNATGVIIHTNLGRSPLADSAVEAVADCARSYSTLEYDCIRQQRGSRQDHCARLLTALTGAEAALVVNNNAAAVLLTLSALAADREVVVSRGELIEIGGSFRLPDIMAASGATMVEVGTTNKTHADDYARAIGDSTAMLLKVHPSNYAIVGFSETVDAATIGTIAQKANAQRTASQGEPTESILVYEDLGSGCLIDFTLDGFHEPTVKEALDHGCDLVSFSSDKLLGGPQAGIVVGRADLIAQLQRHPLMRAMRPDKMTLAALEATLQLYLEPDRAVREIPTLRMLLEPAEGVKQRAEELLRRLEDAGVEQRGVVLAVIPVESCTGGGSLPLLGIESYGVALTFHRGTAANCQRFLAQEAPTPIIARIHENRLVFDLRTVPDDALDLIVTALNAYLAN